MEKGELCGLYIILLVNSEVRRAHVNIIRIYEQI